MSKTYSFGALRPNRSSKILARIVGLLAADAARRVPPPISLFGRPPPPPPPPPAVARVQCDPSLECNTRLYRGEAEPEDGKGPYSHEQLLRMDARFTQRLERAFASGGENRAAASARFLSHHPGQRTGRPRCFMAQSPQRYLKCLSLLSFSGKALTYFIRSGRWDGADRAACHRRQSQDRSRAFR